uniref:G protein-coupled receptor n=1 Tax=Pristionchus pacificus TaxID=54126 RepID=A0A8R1V2Q7_PRIPA
MSWLLLATQFICTGEGLAGALLNVYLFCLVAVSKKSSMSDRVYKAHIFREGTFITAVVGPLAHFLPRPLSMIIIRITMVLATMIWTLIPAMSTLQLITLTRNLHWSAGKRLVISFLFPCVCIAIVATTVEELIPSYEFENIMIRISQEVYDMNGTLITFGSTMRYPELNFDRTLVNFALFYAIVPYSLTYAALGILIYKIQSSLHVRGMTLSRRTVQMQRAFFVMQLLQSVLPLIILSSPFTVFLYGTDLGLSALWFTSFLWLCPSVQAVVQLRYIIQAAKTRLKETTQVSVISKTRGSTL